MVTATPMVKWIPPPLQRSARTHHVALNSVKFILPSFPKPQIRILVLRLTSICLFTFLATRDACAKNSGLTLRGEERCEGPRSVPKETLPQPKVRGAASQHIHLTTRCNIKRGRVGICWVYLLKNATRFSHGFPVFLREPPLLDFHLEVL